MFQVNIYIETSIYGPAVKDGAYGYVIEYKKKSGAIETREDFGSLKETTEKQLSMTALKAALERLTKPCSVLVFIGCKWIQSVCENDWISKWKANNWKTARGQQVKNIELWKDIERLMERHYVEFATSEDKNTFKNWLDEEIRYWMEENAINTK